MGRVRSRAGSERQDAPPQPAVIQQPSLRYSPTVVAYYELIQLPIQHGVDVAGLKLDGKPQSVFALLGDGECQEGQVWEAAMFAAHRNLDNLVAVVDRNCLQIDGDTADVCDPGDLAAKFQAFGWDAREVDGHDMAALVEALAAAKADRAGKPHALIARTVKGKGVSFMENQAGWHGKAPNAEQMETALAELAAPSGEESSRG